MTDDFGLKVAVADMVGELLGDTYEHRKSTAAAVSPDGTVTTYALAGRLPWLAHSGQIAGALSNGSNQLNWHMAQGGMIRHVAFSVRTAPSGGPLTFTISGGSSTEAFSLQAGLSSGQTPAAIDMTEGAWARLNIVAANGAADLSVTIQYQAMGSATGTPSGGGSGGSGGGAVSLVNGKTGVVVLDADDIDDAATTHKFVTSGDLTTLANTSGVNTGDQDLSGYALASSLHLVATSGQYSDLSGKPTLFDGDYDSLANKPTLGTAAAADTSDFATDTQGGKADTAVQPGDLGDVATSNDYDDLDNKPAIPAQFNPIAGANMNITGTYPNITFNSTGGGGGGGDMAASTYDPTNVADDAFDMDNMVEGSTNKILTSAERADIASAVQPGDLAAVATSGAYNDLSGKPTIPDELADLDTTVTGSQLDSMKSKVDGIAAGAEVNVQSDWDAVSGDAFIQNKPYIPIPFVAHSGNSGTVISTTSISTFSYHTLRTITVPPGTYRVDGVVHVPMSRDVGAGEIWVDMRVGGTSGAPRGGNMGPTFLNLTAGEWFPMSAGMGGDEFTTVSGSVALEIGIRGGAVAGTTQARIAYMIGTLTRVS